MTPLPFDSVVDEYQRQADSLFDGWQSGDAQAVKFFRAHHPKFLDEKVPWLERFWESDAEARAIPVTRDDARLAVARSYNFLDWQSLAACASEVADGSSAVSRFERAAEAVIDGDAGTLRRMLAADPDLVRARSTRVCNFDPPVHRATLLHYLAANGVETYRQRTPKNAVEIAKILLDAGADPNALQGSYGSENTTMAMLVSSSPPRQAGLQVPLLETLIDYGAAVEPRGTGMCADPLICALVFGSHEAADALVRRGARVDSLPKAAGLGWLDEARALLPAAGALDRHRALAVAAMLGRLESVRLLLDAGEDPNRFNPEGYHAHATPLHQSIAQGHVDVAKLLIERGARLDIKDHIFRSTPLGWAEYCDQPRIAALIKERPASGHAS
jgi:ankyrin repeat protein